MVVVKYEEVVIKGLSVWDESSKVVRSHRDKEYQNGDNRFIETSERIRGEEKRILAERAKQQEHQRIRDLAGDGETITSKSKSGI